MKRVAAQGTVEVLVGSSSVDLKKTSLEITPVKGSPTG
jgi:hypothetical protein